MADPRFFKNNGPTSLAELAVVAGAKIYGDADPSLLVKDVAPLDQANISDLSFFDNVKYKEALKQSKAGVCILHESAIKHAPAGMALLVSASPYKGYAKIAQFFYPDNFPDSGAEISPFAHIDGSASIGAECRIEAGAIIQEGAKIGAGCWIESGAVIHRHVKLGDHCRIGSNASVSHALLGSYIRLYPGVRVGQDGFGFAIDPKGHVKIPQLGRVIIEDHVEIGANTTIDRGAGTDTVIGQGTWIDNLVQIGHNVQIGRGCILVSQCGVAGSAKLDDFVVLGGQVGVAGHLHIGAGTQVAGQSGVTKDIPPGQKLMGSPAMPMKKYLKQVAILKRIGENKK